MSYDHFYPEDGGGGHFLYNIPTSFAASPAQQTSTTSSSLLSPRTGEVLFKVEGEKGLENDQGKNNCFLNVGIQSLWHLTAFTKRFNTASRHHHQEPCVFCALKSIFVGYEFSEEAVLPPDVLREALSALYKKEGRFQLGEMDDAAETLHAILTNIHEVMTAEEDSNNGKERDTKNEQLKQSSSSFCMEPPCIAHEVFGMNLLEQIVCESSGCGDSSEPISSDHFIYYIYTTSLRMLKKQNRDMSFCALLKQLSAEDKRPCSNEKCKRLSTVKRYLLHQPEVFTIGMVWETNKPSVEAIIETLCSIEQRIQLKDIFDSAPSPDASYMLRGMVCYYGLHYLAFFFNVEKHRWIVFDDATVKEAGSSFDRDIVERCRRGHFQPALLFYVLVHSESCASPSPSSSSASSLLSPRRSVHIVNEELARAAREQQKQDEERTGVVVAAEQRVEEIFEKSFQQNQEETTQRELAREQHAKGRSQEEKVEKEQQKALAMALRQSTTHLQKLVACVEAKSDEEQNLKLDEVIASFAATISLGAEVVVLLTVLSRKQHNNWSGVGQPQEAQKLEENLRYLINVAPVYIVAFGGAIRESRSGKEETDSKQLVALLSEDLEQGLRQVLRSYSGLAQLLKRIGIEINSSSSSSSSSSSVPSSQPITTTTADMGARWRVIDGRWMKIDEHERGVDAPQFFCKGCQVPGRSGSPFCHQCGFMLSRLH
ncbi:protein deubiquitination [Balamuthia mandrillaris]